MTSQKEIAKRISARRLLLDALAGGYDQVETARRLGWTLDRWKRIEAGDAPVYAHELHAVALALRCSPLFLLGEGADVPFDARLRAGIVQKD